MAQQQAPDNPRTDAVLITEYDADKAGVGTGEVRRTEEVPIPDELTQTNEITISLSDETIEKLGQAIGRNIRRR